MECYFPDYFILYYYYLTKDLPSCSKTYIDKQGLDVFRRFLR